MARKATFNVVGMRGGRGVVIGEHKNLNLLLNYRIPISTLLACWHDVAPKMLPRNPKQMLNILNCLPPVLLSFYFAPLYRARGGETDGARKATEE